jgi:Fe-Mn family superoxide dismutase
MKHLLPELPYAADAFSPFITGEGFDYHHGNPHQTYLKNLNDLIRDSSLAERDLVSLVTHAWEKKMCPCSTRPPSI